MIKTTLLKMIPFCPHCLTGNIITKKFHPKPYAEDTYVWLCRECHGKQYRGDRRGRADFEQWLTTGDVTRTELYKQYILARAAVIVMNRNPSRINDSEIIHNTRDILELYRKLKWRRRKMVSLDNLWQDYSQKHEL
jgi:hypothetical protein